MGQFVEAIIILTGYAKFRLPLQWLPYTLFLIDLLYLIVGSRTCEEG